MPFVSVNEIQHVAIQMRLPQRYSTNCKDWKSYLEVWRFKLNIFPSTLFFNFFQREIFYYIEILFYFNVYNFQEWKGSFQSFFFSEVPSWADCFESKAVWYWTSQGCTETCFTASRPWWYWKDSASIETGKKKKKSWVLPCNWPGSRASFCLFMSKEEKNGHQSLNFLD